jgi:hypothetical protein
MRLRFSVPKASWSFVSLAAVLSTTILVGCDSSTDLNSPAAQKNREELGAIVQKQEEQASKGSRSPKGVVLKSIKGIKNQPEAK